MLGSNWKDESSIYIEAVSFGACWLRISGWGNYLKLGKRRVLTTETLF
jgi:hypothetical protein